MRMMMRVQRLWFDESEEMIIYNEGRA